MTRARTPRMRAVVVLIAGLLAATVVWAGTALGGGSDDGAKPTPAPAQSQKGSGHDGNRVADKDCPNDRAHDSSIDL